MKREPALIVQTKRRIREEMKRQLEANWTDEKIKERVTRELERSYGEIVAISLGFSRDSWGGRKWEVDHCNGRAGQSDIGERIATAARKAVDDVLINGPEAENFKLTKGQVKAMVDEFKSAVSKRSLDATVARHVSKEIDKLEELLSGKITGAQ